MSKVVVLQDKNGETVYPVGVGFSQQAIVDLFYPVGSYYETSDTSFNPNTAWGGTWVEDTGGRVTLAANSTYTTGETGGATSNSHSHIYGVAANEYFGTLSHSLYLYNNGSEWVEKRGNVIVASEGSRIINNNTTNASKTIGADRDGGTANTDSKSVSTMQPYIVVKRWHRTA